MEKWNVFDVVRYNKKELLEKIKDFLQNSDLKTLEERLLAIKKSAKFIESYNFPQQQEYTPEYLAAFHKYLESKRNLSTKKKFQYKPRKAVVFRKVSRDQINYFREIMKNPKLRDMTLVQKQQLLY